MGGIRVDTYVAAHSKKEAGGFGAERVKNEIESVGFLVFGEDITLGVVLRIVILGFNICLEKIV